jgi:hypothetical protein
MPGKTAAPWEVPFAQAADEAKAFPAAVSQPLAERIAAIFKERLVTVATHGVSFTAASGELVKATGAITVTLPTAAENATVAVLANNHATKLKGAGAAKIYGGHIEGVAEINLVGYQYVVLIADGTNWFILAGEPRSEAKYVQKNYSKAEAEAGVEPSPGYRAEVLISATEPFILSVGSEELVNGAPANTPFTFVCPAGTKWKANKAVGTQTLLL